MRLNLRDMAYVRAAILDLATFRVDGCARVEVGHSPLTSLLDGARAIYPDRTAVASDALLSPAAASSKGGPMVAEGLLLTISSRKFWDRIRIGQRLPPQPAKQGQAGSARPRHMGTSPRRLNQSALFLVYA